MKSIEDDPKVPRRKTSKALTRFLNLHPHNLRQKVEIVIEHFRSFTKNKIGGRAKAMIVTVQGCTLSDTNRPLISISKRKDIRI